jgi:hypothetical protein
VTGQGGIEDLHDFLVGADFVKLAGKLGQQHLAQFGHQGVGGLIRHHLEGLTVPFQAARTVIGTNQFQSQIHDQIDVLRALFDGLAEQF